MLFINIITTPKVIIMQEGSHHPHIHTSYLQHLIIYYSKKLQLYYISTYNVQIILILLNLCNVIS
jgi:hypothetical protein